MKIEDKLANILENYIELEYNDVLLAMKKAYNMAIEDASRAAKVGETSRFQAAAGYSRRVTKPTIEKKSILKLKLKL